ncbi:MAG: hypothetical protein ACUZ8E_09750, partial [Candidatus Anammoxibacter sp.]
MKKINELKIRDVKHLCHNLDVSLKELNYICKNPARFYSRRTIIKKGKVRHLATPKGRLRPILNITLLKIYAAFFLTSGAIRSIYCFAVSLLFNISVTEDKSINEFIAA